MEGEGERIAESAENQQRSEAVYCGTGRPPRSYTSRGSMSYSQTQQSSIQNRHPAEHNCPLPLRQRLCSVCITKGSVNVRFLGETF